MAVMAAFNSSTELCTLGGHGALAGLLFLTVMEQSLHKSPQILIMGFQSLPTPDQQVERLAMDCLVRQSGSLRKTRTQTKSWPVYHISWAK